MEKQQQQEEMYVSFLVFSLGKEQKGNWKCTSEKSKLVWCESVSVGSEGGFLGRRDVVGCLHCEMAGMCCRGLGHSMGNAPGCNTWVGTAQESR